MIKKILATTAVGLSAGSALAGGLDRSFTPVDILFQSGNYAEARIAYINPSVDGVDVLGGKSGSVADPYWNFGAGLKLDINDQFSMALIYDQPYGSDVEYSRSSPMLGGTRTTVSSEAFTALFRYRIMDNYSVYAGPRVVKAKADVTFSGLAYGPASGYNANFKSDGGVGMVAGASYERPDIALRVALTYHSPIKVSFKTDETFPVGFPNPLIPGGVALSLGNTESKLPQSVKLEFQTGIAQNTLLFGSARWSDWSKLDVVPPVLGVGIASLSDAWTFELGVGRKITEKFAASLAFGYEPESGNDLVSPLAPTNGQYNISVGGKYNLTDQVTLSGGIRYTWLGDAKPETGTPDVARANFKNNHAIAYGMKIGYNF